MDGSKPVGIDDWDPKDPAAIQFSSGSWGVAYLDGSTTLQYRRAIGSQEPPYWLDGTVLDTSTDSPALVQLGSTTALFYRKTSGTIKQVFLRTSTDEGLTWSAATQLTTETVSVYQIKASNVGGTAYIFWSLSDTSGLLQYRTSTDLSTWTTKASVGQAIGPNTSNTTPEFDIKKYSSGTWGLAWLDKALTDEQPFGDCSNSYALPVAWHATSSDLSASTWSNKQELTGCYYEMFAEGLSLAQASSGRIYVSYSYECNSLPKWDTFAHYKTSDDSGATWSTKTIYGYEPSRTTTGCDGAVEAKNSFLAIKNDGTIRAFWDQYTNDAGGYEDNYPVQLFRRDLPSGIIIPIPAMKEILSQNGDCVKTTAEAGDPVNVTTGNFNLPETDIAIGGRGPGLIFERAYNSSRLVDGQLGFGWTHNYDMRLTTYPSGEVSIIHCTGRTDMYTPSGGGAYNSPTGLFTTLVQNGDSTWTLTEPNQAKRTFSSAGKLTGIADRNNNAVSLSYNQDGLLSSVTDPGGRSITFTYTGQRITGITDPLSRTVTFSYSGAGDLTSMVDMSGKTWASTYDSEHRMLTKVDPNNHTVFDEYLR